jgi:hypothetical protein
MDAPPHLFLLGAGFSKPAGLPLAAGLLPMALCRKQYGVSRVDYPLQCPVVALSNLGWDGSRLGHRFPLRLTGRR